MLELTFVFVDNRLDENDWKPFFKIHDETF